MTTFNFSHFNHCPQGKIIIGDITGIIGAQLQALGHQANWTDKAQFIHRDIGYNIVVESFADDPATIRRIADAHVIGCRFLYIATEEPTDRGFNHGLEPAMIDRQNAFPEAAKYCDGILHLVPGRRVTDWYSQFASAAYVELGYAPGFVNSEPDIEPDHDFGFYGKMTWRRGHMLARLERETGGKVLLIESLDVPRRERDAIMRRAEVIVQIRANDEWGMVSSTRCATALSFGRPVIAEPHPEPAPWDRIVNFSPSIEAFYTEATFAAANWRDLHRQQFAKFEAILTPEVCIGRPLREIGII